MKDIEFNLIDEPWVRVMLPDRSVKEVSLFDALTQAQLFADLGGELGTQNCAVMRLMLAVLHTVFSRCDETGTDAPLDSEDEALSRWQRLWESGSFPVEPLRRYLDKYHDRFWLFHPKRPFWQVPEAKIGTAYKAAKLVGELSESYKNLRLFPVKTAQGKRAVRYAEAARWVLYVNGFDDTSAKPKGKGLPSPGAGWLGKLGMVYAMGTNLFETLMLNLTMLKDGEELWGDDHPCWELDKPRTAERVEIAVPNNPAELLTLQSRRLLLKRENEEVIGFSLLGGDLFSKYNAFSEQMTAWKKMSDKREEKGFQPRRHDPSRQMWRDYSSYFIVHDDHHLPGVVAWVNALKKAGILKKERMISFRIAAVQYGDKDSAVSDIFSDSITFHLDLLTELGRAWQAVIEEEISRCEKLAYEMGRLSENLCKAAGGKSKSLGAEARQQLYYSLDQPFRRWLERLDPRSDAARSKELLEQWHSEAQEIARKLGRGLVEDSGPAAFAGRYIIEKKNKQEKKQHYAAPEAYLLFLINVSKIYQA